MISESVFLHMFIFLQKICVSEMILRAAKKYFKIHLRQGKNQEKYLHTNQKVLSERDTNSFGREGDWRAVEGRCNNWEVNCQSRSKAKYVG